MDNTHMCVICSLWSIKKKLFRYYMMWSPETTQQTGRNRKAIRVGKSKVN